MKKTVYLLIVLVTLSGCYTKAIQEKSLSMVPLTQYDKVLVLPFECSDTDKGKLFAHYIYLELMANYNYLFEDISEDKTINPKDCFTITGKINDLNMEDRGIGLISLGRAGNSRLDATIVIKDTETEEVLFTKVVQYSHNPTKPGHYTLIDLFKIAANELAGAIASSKKSIQ